MFMQVLLEWKGIGRSAKCHKSMVASLAPASSTAYDGCGNRLLRRGRQLRADQYQALMPTTTLVVRVSSPWLRAMLAVVPTLRVQLIPT